MYKNTIPSNRLMENINADIGVGSLIIFIAMILVAGISASVMIQTMNNLQQQALRTSEETLKDISSGIRVTHVSGYVRNSKITQLAFFVSTTAASEDIDLAYGVLSLSDSSNKVILNYSSLCYSSSASNGLFGTLNSSNLTASHYGIIVIRDADGSCTASTPILNDQDLVVLLVNSTKCFSGIGPGVDVAGDIYPESGVSGSIGFTTPSSFVGTILDLQP
jgi:flagellin FlaB